MEDQRNILPCPGRPANDRGLERGERGAAVGSAGRHGDLLAVVILDHGQELGPGLLVLPDERRVHVRQPTDAIVSDVKGFDPVLGQHRDGGARHARRVGQLAAEHTMAFVESLVQSVLKPGAGSTVT